VNRESGWEAKKTAAFAFAIFAPAITVIGGVVLQGGGGAARAPCPQRVEADRHSYWSGDHGPPHSRMTNPQHTPALGVLVSQVVRADDQKTMIDGLHSALPCAAPKPTDIHVREG